MNIWRLIAHHEYPEEAIEIMKDNNRIAIGWSDIGDLNLKKPSNQSEIGALITTSYPELKNANFGGPSLWNLYQNMQEGDFVILNAKGKRICVFQIVGPYFYEHSAKDVLDYRHQRQAFLTNINPELLWNKSGSAVAKGQNSRWTLAGCSVSKQATEEIYKEGARFTIASTVIERNPKARQKCLEHYGYQCKVCKFDFQERFGPLGKDFIHVHHKNEISTKSSIYDIDPVKDLVPLCPNCHAMAHRKKPAVPIKELMAIYKTYNDHD